MNDALTFFEVPGADRTRPLADLGLQPETIAMNARHAREYGHLLCLASFPDLYEQSRIVAQAYCDDPNDSPGSAAAFAYRRANDALYGEAAKRTQRLFRVLNFGIAF